MTLLLTSWAISVAVAATPLDLPTLPARADDAPTGTAFAAQVAGLPDHERYVATRDQILAGDVPAFLRELVPVTLSGRGAATVTVFVTPDYLAVGSDDDFLTVPLDFVDAAAVARALGFALPTRRIVDAVYAAAPLHLEPMPLPAGPEMRSVPYILEHRALIEAERGEGPRAELVAGTKKDLVLTPQLSAMPDREAIYGWHRSDGRPIQPLSLVHGLHYADYSHGIRLVADVVLVNGEPRSYFDVLADPILGPLLSDEGPFPGAEALMDAAERAGG